VERQLIAYEIHEADDMPIEKASPLRRWMDESEERFAYRCLPLVIANQFGWTVGSPASFTAWWNGGPGQYDVSLDFGDDEPDPRIVAHFGAGVITFSLPYLFRTPPDVQLWVKGPSNEIKDGVQALEGVVETDWSVATFTMNWKLTRPAHVVRFARGEPICQLVPVERALVEELVPLRERLDSDAALAEAYGAWERSRADFNDRLDAGEESAVEARWQKDYFRGRGAAGETATLSHRTKLTLRAFP
jgi:hypothetical protein